MPTIVRTLSGWKIQVGKKIFPKVYKTLEAAQKRVDELNRHAPK